MRLGGGTWVCAGVLALLAAGALLSAFLWDLIFDAVLNTQIALSPTSRAYQQWLAPTVPLYFDIYLFNWTNAERFPAEKPNFKEIGPYRFRERRQHVNISWHPEKASVAYRTFRSWHYEPSSHVSLDDNITSLNVIAASALYRARDWDFIRKKGLAMGLAMFGHHVAVSRLARELLFEGYEDPLLTMAKNMPASATGGAPPVDRFGWFYERNNSLDTDGYMEVTTGKQRGTLPGQMLRWNEDEKLPWYEGSCAQVKGSAGEFLPHDLTEASSITMFVPDLCRPVHMQYTESGQINGLQYHKYVIGPQSFDISSDYIENSCFCDGGCEWSGVMNVSACRFGSPAFITLPHMLHADSRLTEMVTGLTPDPEKHSFYFAVEPKLGVPVDVAARFQLNILVQPDENIALYNDMPKMLFPIFWVEQRVGLESHIAKELRGARGVRDWGATVAAAVAFLLAAAAALATCCSWKKASHYKLPKHIDVPRDESELKLNPK